ncbi:MAG: GAF domain-containing protein, partial [Myxococcaceae bacterium]
MRREVAVTQTRTLELAQIIGPVTTQLLTVEDLAAAAQAIVDQLSRALNAQMAYLASVDGAGQTLTYLASTGLPPEFIEERRSLSMDAPVIIAQAARTREVQEVEDLALLGDEFAMSRRLVQVGARSMLALPLMARGELVGVLAIARSQPGLLSAPERRALEEVAVACALGLNHARALEAARAAQLETAGRLADLERQHRLLEVVLAQAPSGIVAFDAPSGRVLVANAVARELFGGPVPCGPNVACLAQADGHPCAPGDWPLARALAGEGVLDRELLLTRADGRKVPVSVNAAPVKADGATFG